MKKFLVVLITILFTTICLIGCANKKEPTTLIIGGIGPITGDNSTYGISVRQGAEIAIDKINKSGGVNNMLLELKFQDDEADPTKAVNAYNMLIDSGMKISLGAVTSGSCIAVAGETQKDGIFMLTPSGSQKECIQYDNCFRICFTDSQQGTVSVDYIFKNLSERKIAIIYDKSTDYSVGITENFEQESKIKGLEIITKQAFTNQTNTDFSIQLQKAKSSGAELIFLPIYAQEAASVLTQAKKMNLTIPFFGCDGLDGILDKIGPNNILAAEGTMLLTPFAADSKDDLTMKFVKEFKKKHGENQIPNQFAADGYDAIYTIKAALEKSNIENVNISIKELGEKLTDAMQKITVDGLTGKMVWNKKGEPTKEAKAVKIINGKYVAI